MATRKEQAAQSRDRLLNAAAKLISEKGYNNVTIADITAACGMSVGNFYHYFKSKEDVIIAMEREPYERMAAELRTDWRRPVEEQIYDYFCGWTHAMAERYGVNFHRQWFTYHVNNPTPLDDRDNKVLLAAHELGICLKNGVRSGELSQDTPVEELSLELSFLLFGLTFYYTSTSGAFHPLEWVERFRSGTLLPSILQPYRLGGTHQNAV